MLDLPTPPLPLATAYTVVAGEAPPVGRFVRKRPARALRSASGMTLNRTSTSVTPATLRAAVVTARVSACVIGQAAVVRATSTSARPLLEVLTVRSIPSSARLRCSSGSSTSPTASRTACARPVSRLNPSTAGPLVVRLRGRVVGTECAGRSHDEAGHLRAGLEPLLAGIDAQQHVGVGERREVVAAAERVRHRDRSAPVQRGRHEPGRVPAGW